MDVRLSAPTITPPSNATAMMVVCEGKIHSKGIGVHCIAVPIDEVHYIAVHLDGGEVWRSCMLHANGS